MALETARLETGEDRAPVLFDEETEAFMDAGPDGLRSRSAETVRALVEVIEREGKRRERRLVTLLGLGTLYELGLLVFSVTTPPNEFGWVALAFLLLLTLSFLPSRRLREAMRALTLCEDVSAVGSLFDLSQHILSGQVKKAVWEALARLVPRLRAGDSVYFTDHHHRLLKSRLRGHLKAGLLDNGERGTLLMLKALEQVGDQRELDPVRSLAERPAKSASQQRVRDAAVECLAYLQVRADAQRSRETLLRAAAPGDSAALLRPALVREAADPEQLLRAGTTSSPL